MNRYVGLPGTLRSYDEFSVQSVFKHPEFSEDYKNDIALLRVHQRVARGKSFINFSTDTFIFGFLFCRPLEANMYAVERKSTGIG